MVKLPRRLCQALRVVLLAAVPVSILPAASGCDVAEVANEVAQGAKQAQKVTADIKSTLAVDSKVSFQIDNNHRKITVELKAKPKGDEKTAKTHVETIVRRHFPKVDEIVVNI